MSLRKRLALISVAALLGLAGCGGESEKDDEADAKAVVKKFLSSLAGSNGEEACAQLNESGEREVGADPLGTPSCVEALQPQTAGLKDKRRNQLRKIDPQVQVDGDRATATYRDGGKRKKITLEKDDDGEWKIAKLR
jgi:hypothetical protein